MWSLGHPEPSNNSADHPVACKIGTIRVAAEAWIPNRPGEFRVFQENRPPADQPCHHRGNDTSKEDSDMAKYYVRSGWVRVVLDARTPREAAVKAIQWSWDRQAEVLAEPANDRIREAEIRGVGHLRRLVGQGGGV